MLYLVYVQSNTPSGSGSGPLQATSLAEAEDLFGLFVLGSFDEQATASVYAFPYSEYRVALATAREYADLGCPFDYPDFVIRVGPRGGIKRERV